MTDDHDYYEMFELPGNAYVIPLPGSNVAREIGNCLIDQVLVFDLWFAYKCADDKGVSVQRILESYGVRLKLPGEGYSISPSNPCVGT